MIIMNMNVSYYDKPFSAFDYVYDDVDATDDKEINKITVMNIMMRKIMMRKIMMM